jgi:hypothetical protein
LSAEFETPERAVLQNQAVLAASEAESKMLLSQAQQLQQSRPQGASPVAAALENFAQKLQVGGVGFGAGRHGGGFKFVHQAPAPKSWEGAGGAAGKSKGDSLFGSILKEEEELEMIKALPADSALRSAARVRPRPQQNRPTAKNTFFNFFFHALLEPQGRSTWRT